MLKAIFWDNDGVLVDTEKYYFEANRAALELIGITLTREQYIQISLVEGRSVWCLADGKGIDDDVMAAHKKRRDEIYRRSLTTEDLVIPGVPEVLEKYFGRYKMGIVTSSTPENFYIIHNRTGLLKYVDFVLTPDRYTLHKPHPEPYLAALKMAGVKKEECAVIEDTQRGLAAAVAAGLRCVIVAHELSRECTFAGAFAKIDNIEKLDTVIAAM
jgi:HAD superfamily hydrolase (TIGR01509 family)